MAISYSPNEQRRQFRQQIGELYRKRKDPDYVRYAFEQQGYDTAAIDEELGRLTGQFQAPTIPTTNVGGGQFEVRTISDALAVEKRAKEENQAERTKKSAQRDLQDKLESLQEIQGLDEGLQAAVGPNFAARPPTPFSGTRQEFLGSVENIVSTEVLDTLIQAKSEGATFGALSDQELNLLKASASRIGKWAITDKKGKVVGYNVSEEAFRKELQKFQEKTAEALQLMQTSAEQTTPTEQTTAQVSLNSPEEAAQWLQQNPSDPRAAQVRQKLASVGFQADEPQVAGATTSVPEKNEPQDFSSSARVTEGPDAIDKAGKAGDILGSFFGGKQYGRAIGDIVGSRLAKHGEAGETYKKTIENIEQKFANGEMTKERRDQLLDATEQGMRDALGYDGPGLKKLTADTAYIALTFLPAAKAAKGASLGAKAGVFGVNAAKAGAAGAALAVAEDKDPKKAAMMSAGSFVAISGLAAGAGKLAKGLGFVGKKGGASLSGLGDDVVDEIIANPGKARQGMRQVPDNVIKEGADESIKVLDDYIAAYQGEYKKSMKAVEIAGLMDDVDPTKVKASLGKKTASVLKDYRITQGADGLDFSKSRFADPSDAKRIQLALQEIDQIDDVSPFALNQTRQRIAEYRKADTPDNKVVNKAIDSITKALKSEISGMGDEIAAINNTYSRKADLAEAFRREIGGVGSTNNPSRIDIINAQKRISTLFTRNKDATREVFREIGAGGVVSLAAGAEVNRVGAGQSAKITETLMNVLRSFGTPKVVGEGAAIVGEAKTSEFVQKVLNDQTLTAAEQALLTRLSSVLGVSLSDPIENQEGKGDDQDPRL